MIYFLFAFFATIFAYLATNTGSVVFTFENNNRLGTDSGKNINYSFIFLSFLCYFIPAAIRYGIGQDYFYTYVPMFNSISTGAKSIYTNEIIEYSEFGFNFLNKVVAYFTSDAQYLIAVVSLISLVLAYICICRYSVNISLSVFMLVLGSYYLGTYSFLRQGIAIVIFLYSLQFVKDRKPIAYFVCMLLAFSVHTSALIYIPFYFIGNIKLTRKKYITYSIVAIVGILLSSRIIVRIVSMTRFANRINFSSKFNILFSITIVCVFLFALMGYDENVDDVDNDWYRIFLNVIFVATCLIGVSGFLDTSDRLIMLYYYTNFVTIPYFISRGRPWRYKQVALLLLFVVMGILWGWEHIYYDQFSILPYVTIFSQ